MEKETHNRRNKYKKRRHKKRKKQIRYTKKEKNKERTDRGVSGEKYSSLFLFFFSVLVSLSIESLFDSFLCYSPLIVPRLLPPLDSVASYFLSFSFVTFFFFFLWIVFSLFFIPSFFYSFFFFIPSFFYSFFFFIPSLFYSFSFLSETKRQEGGGERKK